MTNRSDEPPPIDPMTPADGGHWAVAGADGARPPAGHAGLSQGEALKSEALADDDLDLLDPLWTQPKRVNRLTVLLAGGLVAVLGFAGGVLVQKHHDSGLVAPTAGAQTAARAFARSGAGGGGLPDFGALPGGSGGVPGVGNRGAVGGGTEGGIGSGPGTGTGRGTGESGGTGGSGSGSGVPVVVGKVVSVNVGGLVVEDFAGRRVAVHVAGRVPVTTAGLGGLRAGATVSVSGSRAADGSVTASSVVSRSAG